MGKRPNKARHRKGAAVDDVLETQDQPMSLDRNPEEIDRMTVISNMRSKANNRARHQAEYAVPKGVDPNGAKVFRSVANLGKVRRKQIVKDKKELEKRAEKALAALDRSERKAEKYRVKKAEKSKSKKLWE